MENIVSLGRQLWAFNDFHCINAIDSNNNYAFTIDNENKKLYLLTPKGLIYSQEIENKEDEIYELLYDINDLHLTVLKNTLHWKWIQYIYEMESLVLAEITGTLVLYNVNTNVAQEIGVMEMGIRGLQWSSDQGQLAIATGTGMLLIMNTLWEVLYETDINAILPQDYTLLKVDILDICWREDGHFCGINISTMSMKDNRRVRKVIILTNQLELHSIGRMEDGRDISYLGECIAWCPDHSLIACWEKRKRNIAVVFFERNGLRHGEFILPKQYVNDEYSIIQIQWNIDSNLLAVSLEGHTNAESILQIYKRENYHWYLKQERHFHISSLRIKSFTWDVEAANRIYILLQQQSDSEVSLELHCEDLTLQISRIERQKFDDEENSNASSTVIVGVIDQNKVLLTPFHRAIVPPPMAFHTIEFGSPAINSIAFHDTKDVLVVLFANGLISVVEHFMTPKESQSSIAYSNEKELNHHEIQISSLLWATSNSTDDLLVAVKLLENSEFCLLSIADGIAHRVNTPLIMNVRNVAKVENCSKSAGSKSWALQCNNSMHLVDLCTTILITKIERSDLTYLSDEFTLVRETSHDEDQRILKDVVISLNKLSAKLYCNNRLLVNSCTSFQYIPEFQILLYVKIGGAQSNLHILPLSSLMSDKDLLSTEVESRAIERGAKIITTIPHKAQVVMQLPRGNLECITPRAIVLLLVLRLVAKKNYVEALELGRKHRLDINVVIDFNRQAFFESLKNHLLEPYLASRMPKSTISDRLCVFITNLHSIDVWQSKYRDRMMPFIPSNQENIYTTGNEDSDKVTIVCQKFMQSVEEIISQNTSCKTTLLLPYLTCAVKQNPPQYVKALAKIQDLASANSTADSSLAKKAMKHLIYLTNSDTLCDEALGMYDMNLVDFVFSFSQKDPQEYQAFHRQLKSLYAENKFEELQYKIDMSLNRFDKALNSLCQLWKKGLMLKLNSDSEEYLQQIETQCLELLQHEAVGSERLQLYNHALKLFWSPESSKSRLYNQILQLKADLLFVEQNYETAAYIFKALGDSTKARLSFLKGGQWQMALSMVNCSTSSNEKATFGYEAIAELNSKIDAISSAGNANEVSNLVIAVAMIYANYCGDMDEAISFLIKYEHWDECIRLTTLHCRKDLLESDIEPGVLACAETVTQELIDAEEDYMKHWKRLTEVREQKRLFELHGIDGKKWENGKSGIELGSSDVGSIAESAFSNTSSLLSVGSHNSAHSSIGNFSLSSLSLPTQSHFFALSQNHENSTQRNKSKCFNGKRTPRQERRSRIQRGSVEEDNYLVQKLKENRPTDRLIKRINCLLKILVYLGHLSEANKLQALFKGVLHRLLETYPIPESIIPTTKDKHINSNMNSISEYIWEIPYAKLK